jgi:hypothetical protein
MALLKNIAKRTVNIILHLLFLDYLIYLVSKLLYALSKLLYLREWRFNNTVPMFFKHQINFNYWRFNPTEWSFTLRGVHARQLMQPNCKVLDLCCGDGIYSYLFFSDTAVKIDAVDYDDDAINYASKFFKRDNINYKKINIITNNLPANDYDIVVWNAGICYFTINELHLILAKLIQSCKPNMILCGMLPKANGHIDHKTEFESIESLKTLFDNYFNNINIKAVIEGNNINIVTFYFNVDSPKKGN